MKKITNELIKNFRRYLIEEEKAAATVEKYIRDINVFADWLGNKAFDKTGRNQSELLCRK